MQCKRNREANVLLCTTCMFSTVRVRRQTVEPPSAVGDGEDKWDHTALPCAYKETSSGPCPLAPVPCLQMWEWGHQGWGPGHWHKCAKRQSTSSDLVQFGDSQGVKLQGQGESHNPIGIEVNGSNIPIGGLQFNPATPRAGVGWGVEASES